MALNQKACKPEWIILREDPSLLPGSNYNAYAESNFADRSHLKIDPLNPPSEFLLRPPTDAQKQGLDAASGRARQVLKVMFSLMQIRNYEWEDIDGRVTSDHTPKRCHKGRLGDIVDQEWMEAFNLRDEVLDALDAVITVFGSARRPLSRPSSTQSGSAESSRTGESTAS